MGSFPDRNPFEERESPFESIDRVEHRGSEHLQALARCDP